MSQRPQLALVLVLAIVLLVGLAGIFLWGGFGLGEGVPEGEPATTATAGDRADPGSLKGDAGVEGERTRETDRENMQLPVAASTMVECTGRLVRSDGTPGAGLMLRFSNAPGGQTLNRQTLNRQTLKAARIKTGTDGSFRVQAAAGSTGHLILEGPEAVFKEGSGRGMAVRMGKQSKDLGDVLILMAARVSGQVVDTTGRPAAGVSVSLGDGDGDGTSIFWTLLRGGKKTDKDGRFDLAGLRPGQHKLLTRSPDHLPAEREVELAEGQHREGIIIQVQPGGFILGTVVDDLGQPVADAEVVASRTQQLGVQIKISGFSPGESTRTDQAGRFRMANLSTEKATLRVTKTGLATQMVSDVVVGTTNLVVEMKRLGAVEGIVLDEQHRPVEGSTVSAAGSSGGIGGPLLGNMFRSGTVTDATGAFRLENLQPGRVTVTARSDSHLPAQEQVQVRPGETTKGVRLVATPGTALEVTVQDAAGQPVANATVTVKEKNSDGSWPIPGGRRSGGRVRYRSIRRSHGGPPVFLGAGNTLGEGKTDARGKVTIDGLPGGEVLVGARHEELALVGPQELSLPERGKATTLLNMHRGGFLLVSAVDAAGKPVPNARFKVTPTTNRNADQQDADSQEESCDRDGKARVGPLSAGDYSATLLGEQRPRIRGGMSFTVGGAEQSLDDSKVTLQVLEGSATEVVLRKPVLTNVKGSVRDRSGPVKGAQVALTREGGFRSLFGNGLEATTDEDGRFEIADVPSGKYTLSWGRRSAVVPSEDEVRLEKNQPELVRQLVIPGAVVKLRTWDVEEDEAVADAEVTLSPVRAPTPGQGQQRRQRTQVRMISITNNSSGSQRVDMSAGDRTARTGEDGAVVIKDVPPGKYELTIKHRRFATHREEIEILADATLDLGTKKLTSGGSVSGRILLEDAGPLQMALVQLTTWDGKNTERTMSTGGRFRFSGLATGKYKVRAQRIGKANEPWGPEETVEVKPRRTARTQVKLP